MKLRQLAGIAERKVRHTVVPRLPINFDQRYEEQVPNKLIVTPQPIADNSSLLRKSLDSSERERYRNRVYQASEGRLTFLNRSIHFGDEINWEHEELEEYPLLWRLKLQSFEFLEWAVLGFNNPIRIRNVHTQFQRWLLSWTANNPIGDSQYLRRSWIPHSVSLRILNWSRYAAWCEQADLPVDDRLYRQIYKNALFLDNHIEFEIGGNHLIENAIALVMAGVLFEEHNTGWIKTGMEVLDYASETQFLADGGHFERSPMYHLMVLRRYATAFQLLTGSGYSTARLKTTAEQALGFLSAISEPAGEIPLLNDSVYGEQISASACMAYSKSCGLYREKVSLNHPAGSGYRKLTTENSTLLVNVGDVGPPHLPAHSHNDHLSVLLWIDGNPILTDTGVYDYAPTPRRQYSRSVSAHNTVQYRDVEPIPVGGSFLMGNRTEIKILEDNTEIQAQYSRKTLINSVYTHQREIEGIQGGWLISDTIRDTNNGVFTVRYHFHPSIMIKEINRGEYKIYIDNEELAKFDFSGIDNQKLIHTPYFEQYGSEQDRLTIEASTNAPNQICTQISIEEKST